jgi:transcriptional regulator with PAS, ATPase and Fis domain
MSKVVIGGKSVSYTIGLLFIDKLMCEHHQTCEKAGKKLRALVSTKKAVAQYAVLGKHRIEDLATYLGINRATLYNWVNDYKNGNLTDPTRACCIQRRG